MRKYQKMTRKREFILLYYGNDKQYLRARKADYRKVQFNWSCWLDELRKSGEITQKEYDSATF